MSHDQENTTTIEYRLRVDPALDERVQEARRVEARRLGRRRLSTAAFTRAALEQAVVRTMEAR